MYNASELLCALEQNIRRLPAKYFGEVMAAGGATEVRANGTERFLHQTVVGGKVYQAGDIIPTGTVLKNAQGQIQIPNYVADSNPRHICKIIHKDAAPVLAGFETTTEFWNPSNLSRNDYLHFLYNSFDRFTGYPWVSAWYDPAN